MNLLKIFKRLRYLKKLDLLLILVGITGAAVLLFIFFRKTTYITVTIKVDEESIRYVGEGTRVWFSQMFYPGMKQVDGVGKTVAQVEKIRSYDTTPAKKAVYLTTKIRVVYNRGSNQYTFDGLPVLIGSTIKLYLDKLFVNGLITNIEGVHDPRIKTSLLVDAIINDETPVYPDTSGTKPYVADALKIGDQIKDDQGNTILTIVDKKEEDAKKITINSAGTVTVQTNPLRKDVYLKIRMESIKIQNRYYIFDDVPVLIGIGIPVNTDYMSVWPEVTNITPINKTNN